MPLFGERADGFQVLSMAGTAALPPSGPMFRKVFCLGFVVFACFRRTQAAGRGKPRSCHGSCRCVARSWGADFQKQRREVPSMTPAARARTAAPSMQAMDNLKTLAKELNPVVGSSGAGYSVPSGKSRVLVMSKVVLCAMLPDFLANLIIFCRKSVHFGVALHEDDENRSASTASPWALGSRRG